APRFVCALAALTLFAAAPKPEKDSDRERLLALQEEAVRLVREAAQPPAPARALAAAAEHLEALAKATAPPTADGAALSQAAREMRARAHGPAGSPSFDTTLRLLERVGKLLAGAPRLDFQGSYAQPKVDEPAYGGHASAMGPAPGPAPRAAG